MPAEFADRIMELSKRYWQGALSSESKSPSHGWYRLTAEEMAQAIEKCAHRLYPTVNSFLDHAG